MWYQSRDRFLVVIESYVYVNTCINMNMHTHEPDAQRIEGSAELRQSTKVTVISRDLVCSFLLIYGIWERDLLSRGRLRNALLIVNVMCV